MEQCLKAGHIDALNLPGLKPDRKAVLGGGLSILYTLAMHFDIEIMKPAKGALRQGVIFDLEERLLAARDRRQPDPREAAVRELQRRFNVDVAHAERVRNRAQTLWSGLQPDRARLAGRDESALELGWASALHEIGMMVSHHDHHRHSAYLLGHVDAAGFSQSQQRRLADLVLGQRGELSKLAERRQDKRLMQQVLCLRLAVILHHARTDLPARVARLEPGRARATLLLQRRWAEQHPRTLHLLEQEATLWSRQGDRELAIQLLG